MTAMCRGVHPLTFRALTSASLSKWILMYSKGGSQRLWRFRGRWHGTADCCQGTLAEGSCSCVMFYYKLEKYDNFIGSRMAKLIL